MAGTNYSEKQLIEGIKQQNKNTMVYLLQVMAPASKKIFRDMDLHMTAREEEYKEIFQSAFGILFREIRSKNPSFGVQTRLKQLLESLTEEHFLLEAPVKAHLAKRYIPRIAHLVEQLTGPRADEELPSQIFDDIYDFICEKKKINELKSNGLRGLVNYNIKVKVADHLLDFDKTWDWIDQELQNDTIRAFSFMHKDRKDINCEAIFNECLENAWIKVKNNNYHRGSNIFEYIKSTYQNKLRNFLKRKVHEKPIEDEEGGYLIENNGQQKELPQLSFRQEDRLSNEILQEVLIMSIDDMKDRKRNLIYDFRFANKPLGEIAKDQNVKETSMKVLNHRVTKDLLNSYFRRLIDFIGKDMITDCLDKLENKALRLDDPSVWDCRQRLKALAKDQILLLIGNAKERYGNCPEEEIKSFVYSYMSERVNG